MLERFEVNVSPVISALYVDPKGCYAGLEGVDLWDEARDAQVRWAVAGRGASAVSALGAVLERRADARRDSEGQEGHPSGLRASLIIPMARDRLQNSTVS